MKTANKIIMSGLAALLGACSNEAVVPDITGATTEPNSSKTANLTEEQKAVLAKAFSSNGVSASDIFEYATYLSKVEIEQRFSYPSKDGRRTCDVVKFRENNESSEMGVLRAFSYDTTQYVSNPNDPSDYMRNNKATLVGTQFVAPDGVPVVLTTVFSRLDYGYWKNDITCSEYFNQFKQSCFESNGLFKNFGSGCHANYLFLGCAKFAPENADAEELRNAYTEEYKNECVEDSIHYAPRDDENYVNNNSDDANRDEERELYTLDYIWTSNNLLKSLNAYKWQFTLAEKTYVVRDGVLMDNIDEPFADDSVLYMKTEFNPPELQYILTGGVEPRAYNTLPEGDFADEYRNEGVYDLPDSLLALFFPHTATRPKERKDHSSSLSGDYYMIVLKDIGAKGHVLTGIDTNGIYVTDIVKSGNSCPSDDSVHYSAFLVSIADYVDWNIKEKTIVKTTYISENWNCDVPKSLKLIEPYGEWSFRIGELCRDPDGNLRVVENCLSAMLNNTIYDYPLI